MLRNVTEQQPLERIYSLTDKAEELVSLFMNRQQYLIRQGDGLKYYYRHLDSDETNSFKNTYHSNTQYTYQY